MNPLMRAIWNPNSMLRRVLMQIYQTSIQGIVFFLPLFYLVMLLIDVVQSLEGIASKIVDYIGIEKIWAIGDILGFGTTIGISIFLLVLILYINGLIVKLVVFESIHDWLETNVFDFIPGYIAYKVYFKTQVVEDLRQPVLVRNGKFDAERPALLLDTNSVNNKATVFVPNTPDSKTGEVWIVSSEFVKELKGYTASELLMALQCPGAGLTEDGSYEDYRKHYNESFPDQSHQQDDEMVDNSWSGQPLLRRQNTV